MDNLTQVTYLIILESKNYIAYESYILKRKNPKRQLRLNKRLRTCLLLF